MLAEIFRRSGLLPAEPARAPDPAFAARPRLILLRDALARAAKQLRSRWNEPAVFFFDPKRQAELEAARAKPPDRFAGLADLIATEMPTLLAHVEVRRVARALDGFSAAAVALASHCLAANDLADLLTVPDDEVFLALTPHTRTGVRLHVRGAASVAQLHRLLAEPLPPAPSPKKGGGEEQTGNASAPRSGFSPSLLRGGVGEGFCALQLFAPAALLPDGTLPAGFAGCGRWLWPTQPLAMVPRVNGERVVLAAPSVVRPAPDAEVRFPTMAVESEVIQTLNPFQVAEVLSRLAGRTVPVAVPADAQTVARAA